MAVRYSSVFQVYAIVLLLLVVKLPPCLATEINTTALIRSHALNVNSALKESNLKPNAVMTSTDSEERIDFARISVLEGLSLSEKNMLQTSSKFSQSGFIAKIIREFQILWWRLLRKSDLDVFILLKLDLKGHELFNSAGFRKWTNFIASKKDTKAPKDVILDILKQYYKTDEELVNLLLAGTTANTYYSRDYAIRLLEHQVKRLINEQKPLEDIFRLLKVKKGTDVFGNTHFLYIVKLHTKISGEDTGKVLLTQLRNVYGDDLLNVLSAEARNPRMPSMVPRVLRALRSEWTAEGKKAAETFNLFQFKDKTDTIFYDPIFQLLAQVCYFNI
ncbi:unnamed protein product [Peronospora belbahrii]|uniref:RxLR effector protein n=1 Tax=Peronospora belbahrii TaxID=622444 RepID=A0AAU9L9D6_9STRA|nr:unnamed protein product [Peronospora belbahrii]